MSTIQFQNYDKLRSKVDDATAANILSALVADDVCNNFVRLGADWGDNAELFMELMESLCERGCIEEMVKLLKILSNLGDHDYPTCLAWAEKDPDFLALLLPEMCQDFRNIFFDEYEEYFSQQEDNT